MKILLVSQLYPFHVQSKCSPALHFFAKEWQKTNEIKVLRPYFKYEGDVIPSQQNTSFEGVDIQIITPIWIPVIKYAISNYKKAYKALNFKPDIIISHLYNSYLYLDEIAKLNNIPHIIGIHNSDITSLNHPILGRRILKRIKTADALVFRSAPLKKLFLDKFGAFNLPTFIANSGLPESFIKNAESILESKKEANYQGIKKFITASKLIKLKQIDKVLYGLSVLNQQGLSNWTYTIIGDGVEYNNLKALSEKLKIDDKVEFTGYKSRTEVFDLLKLHHFFIMPSQPETFGLAYLEAMAAGCIVLGSKGWGIDGIINNEVNGLLCSPLSQESINSSIHKFLNSKPDVLNNWRQKSLKTVTAFTDQQMAEAYLNFIKQIKSKNTESSAFK